MNACPARRVLVAVAAAFAAGACSLATDTGGLAGGVMPDASSGSPDGGAALDATVLPDDAGAFDARGTGETDATTFCGSLKSPKICSDFERGDALTGWEVFTEGGGTVDGPQGSPLAVEVAVPASSATNVVGRAGFQWETSGTPRMARATMRFNLVTTPTQTDQKSQIIVVAIESGASVWEADLTVSSARQLSLEERSSSAPTATHPIGAVLTPGWHMVTLEVALSGSSASGTVELDGTTIGVPLTPNVANASTIGVQFGFAWLQGLQSGWSARVGAAGVALDVP